LIYSLLRCGQLWLSDLWESLRMNGGNLRKIDIDMLGDIKDLKKEIKGLKDKGVKL